MSFKANPDVLSRRVGDSMVLLHMGTNRVFELNETSAHVWQLIQGGQGEEAIVETMLDEYDVRPDELRCDVRAAIDDFKANGLIVADFLPSDHPSSGG